MRLKTVCLSFSIIYCIALSIEYKQNSGPFEDIWPYQNGCTQKDLGITEMNDIHPFQLTLTSGNGKVPGQVAYSVHLGRIRWRIAASLPTVYKINLKKWNLAAVHSWIFISFYFVIFSPNRRQNFETGAAEEHSFLSNYRLTCTIFTNKIIRSILTLFTSCKHRHHLNCRTTANFF